MIKTMIIFWVILHAGIGLGPDEAQYWTWSQALDWGYYSKPPGIAWEIWMGTTLFGNTELGVRFGALVIGFVIPLLIYFLTKSCKQVAAVCFWSGVAFALAPAGVLASFLSITDGGMIVFWTASCVYLVRAIENGKKPNYIILGLLICCGALFKWPIYFLWLLVICGGWFYYPQLISGRLLIGIFVSLLALLPSVYWNATHDWATFRHVLATVMGGHGKAKTGGWIGGNVFEFLGAQAALVSPILFILLLLSLWHIFRQREVVSPGILFCGRLTIAVLIAGSVAALFMKVQGNWAIFAYPSAFVVLGWSVNQRAYKKWLIAGLLISVILCGVVFSIPLIQTTYSSEFISLPYRLNAFRHNVGWERLKIALEEEGYDSHRDFLFADKYQMASILNFYGPGQKRAYFLNLHGIRHNQFSFWPGMVEEQVGRRGFFVIVENSPHLEKITPQIIDNFSQQLKPYFRNVEFLGVFPLFSVDGMMKKGALIFECMDYNGYLPAASELY